ncbi:hypothetical protein [Nocardia terpenica]|uniref:Uncharacterized protein n=1 Tax=Nocardia terpenica TaxID=455432 RepID=A0A164LAB5_9NOCA|nr:hypothetical protein [Nocardia terpenica]KZM72185.1 hypothetical protein AWN90_36525 [Nocardia terpenica]NQE86672.1 hypothetical protein [Nocardia terpenica]
MGTFPSPYTIQTKSTALELLEQARQAGMKQSDACVIVAEEFENGPAVSTLHAWAREAGIFKSHRGKRKTVTASTKTRAAVAAPIASDPTPVPASGQTIAHLEDVAVLMQVNKELTGELEANKREIKALRGLVVHYLRPSA